MWNPKRPDPCPGLRAGIDGKRQEGEILKRPQIFQKEPARVKCFKQLIAKKTRKTQDAVSFCFPRHPAVFFLLSSDPFHPSQQCSASTEYSALGFSPPTLFLLFPLLNSRGARGRREGGREAVLALPTTTPVSRRGFAFCISSTQRQQKQTKWLQPPPAPQCVSSY